MDEYDLGSMTQRLLHQVTLASGRIVTNPDHFGDTPTDVLAEKYFWPEFSEDGRPLTVEAETKRLTAPAAGEAEPPQ